MIAIIHRPNRKAQLRWFLLRPDFRGIGLGRALMEKAMEFCRQQQFKEVYLLLTTNQQGKAASIYTKARLHQNRIRTRNALGAGPLRRTI